MWVVPLSKCCVILSISSKTGTSVEYSFLKLILAAKIEIIDMKIIMDLVNKYSFKYL